jgi:hypothetical protein
MLIANIETNCHDYDPDHDRITKPDQIGNRILNQYMNNTK